MLFDLLHVCSTMGGWGSTQADGFFNTKHVTNNVIHQGYVCVKIQWLVTIIEKGSCIRTVIFLGLLDNERGGICSWRVRGC